MPCPAMPCHDTHSSTQTGQPLWPGLISCHSRWSRDQGRSVVCSLTAQVPTELPQTLTVQEQCVYVCGAMSACAHACLHVCLCVGVCGHFCVLEFDNETIKKKKAGCDGEGYIRMQRTHTPSQTSRKKLILLQMWVEKGTV